MPKAKHVPFKDIPTGGKFVLYKGTIFMRIEDCQKKIGEDFFTRNCVIVSTDGTRHGVEVGGLGFITTADIKVQLVKERRKK
ncbi:MAG TPA: hypothetical protein VJK04_00650 [Candidatus Paceibacterota bacterium]